MSAKNKQQDNINENRRRAAIIKAEENHQRLAAALEACIYTDFTKKRYKHRWNESDALGWSVLSLGVSRAVKWAAGDPRISLKRHFKVALGRFKNAQKRLLGEEEKNYFAMHDYNLRLAYEVESAANKNFQAKTEQEKQKVLTKVNDITQRFNMSAEGRRALKNWFQNTTETRKIKPGDFYNKLAEGAPYVESIKTGQKELLLCRPYSRITRFDPPPRVSGNWAGLF